MFYKLSYDVFRERGEKAAYVLVSISLAVYVWQYHLAKSLLALCAILAVMLIIPRVKDYFSGLSKVDIAWLVVLVIYPVSYYLTYLIHDRPMDLSRGNDVAINSLVGFTLYLIIRKTDYFSIEKFCRYILPSIGIAGLILLWRWFFEGFQGRWTIGTNLILVFACVATAVTMLCFWYALHGKEKTWIRFLSLTAGTLGLLSISASAARGAWLAVAVLVCLYIVYGILNKKYAPLMIAITVTVVGMFWIAEERGKDTRFGNTIATVEKYIESGEIETQTGEGISTSLRVQMWSAAIDSIKSSPILGVGSGSFKDTFPEFKFKSVELYMFNHVHNDFLQAWSALGLLGLASIVSLMVIPLWPALSSKSPVTPYIIIVVVVYMVNALTNAPFIRTYSLKYYVFVIGLLLIMHQRYSTKST